jgi:TorA-specific chaperone
MNDLPRPTAFAEPDPREVAALFDWLAAVFAAPPNRETVAAYRRGQAADWLNAVATIPGCAEGVARTRRALDADADDGRVAARIGAAYGMLFEGIGGPKTVSPYESVHRGGRLSGPPAAAMAAILAVHDLSVAASAGEPADHIAVELATASRLLAEAHPDAATMLDRLRGWTSDFANGCIAADPCGFWAGAAEILTAIVGLATRQPGDAETLDAIVH